MNSHYQPPQQPSMLLVIPMWIIAVLLTVAAMYFARNILVPLAMALLLACLLQPLVRFLRKKTGAGAPLSALACILVLVGLQVIAGIWAVTGIMFLSNQAQGIGKHLGDLVAKHEWLQKFLPEAMDLQTALTGLLAREASGAFATASTIIAQWVLVMFMTFFFLAEGDWLLDKMSLMFGQTNEGKRRVAETFERIGRQFVRFMVVRTLINLGLGLSLAISLYFMNVDYAPAWGILAAVLTYIPYLGPLISAVPPALTIILTFNEPVAPLVMLTIIYSAVFVLEGYVAVPVFMGKSLDLNATTVMIACLFWWFVWGEVGLVLAIPFTAAIRLALAEIHGLRYWSDLMSAG